MLPLVVESMHPVVRGGASPDGARDRVGPEAQTSPPVSRLMQPEMEPASTSPPRPHIRMSPEIGPVLLVADQGVGLDRAAHRLEPDLVPHGTSTRDVGADARPAEEPGQAGGEAPLRRLDLERAGAAIHQDSAGLEGSLGRGVIGGPDPVVDRHASFLAVDARERAACRSMVLTESRPLVPSRWVSVSLRSSVPISYSFRERRRAAASSAVISWRASRSSTSRRDGRRPRRIHRTASSGTCAPSARPSARTSASIRARTVG